MTLEEAIGILKNKCRLHRAELGENGLQATNLGIEALKRIQNARQIGYSVPADLLPGEARESE
jgi:hypothetical protein